ncbi:membrane protein [Pseudonocardia sp. N23]|nr:membrane protein [Pseudonocardia sp. N23]
MRSRRLLIKVPEITIWFWIVKVLCTTVGETAADFLNVSLNLGLTGTSFVTGLLLVVVLFLQFRADRYVAVRYWLAVTLVSIFGTLLTDNLTDNLGVPLEASTVIFGALLAVTFVGWYRTEGTLSVHSINTTRREAFYWLTVLFTFALGTATGDLMAEVLGLGYLVTGSIVAGLILLAAIARKAGLHPVLAFWIVYVLTRPLGASIGDMLSQPAADGGLGLGATLTSVAFFVAIIAIVVYLAWSKSDVIPADHPPADEQASGGLMQTTVVLAVLLAAGGTGYILRTSSLQDTSPVPVMVTGPATAGTPGTAAAGPLGDLSSFRTITQDTLDLLNRGDQAGATTRVDALEASWDHGEAQLKPRDATAWTVTDGKIDTVLRKLRSTSPVPATEKAALTDLLSALK